MNDYSIRIGFSNGSYIHCYLGECSHQEAVIHLDNEIRKFAVSPERKGRHFTMVLEAPVPYYCN